MSYTTYCAICGYDVTTCVCAAGPTPPPTDHTLPCTVCGADMKLTKLAQDVLYAHGKKEVSRILKQFRKENPQLTEHWTD